MKKRPTKKLSVWQTELVHYNIKLAFKRKLKKRISSRDINKILDAYVEEAIIKKLEVGGIVDLKFAKIWVKATPISEHEWAMSLLKKGKMFKGGMIVDANLNFDTTKYIYKIMLEAERYKGDLKVHYAPHPKISKAVHEGINKGKLLTRFECQ